MMTCYTSPDLVLLSLIPSLPLSLLLLHSSSLPNGRENTQLLLLLLNLCLAYSSPSLYKPTMLQHRLCPLEKLAYHQDTATAPARDFFNVKVTL